MEIEVRDAGGYPEKEIGKTLMFKAFAPGGPLAKASDDKSDCDALAGLFASALNQFRNPGAHTRRTFQDALEAMEELMLASRLHGGDLGQSVETGDFKYIGGFPHFVADGGDDRVGQWLHEKIDLERIYAEIWKDAAPAHLVDVAVFCDSDNTHMASISYFAYVRLEQETDRDRTILFNSNTFRDGQYAKKALLVLEALTADDRRRLGVDYAAVIVEGAKRPAEATSILE